MIVDAWIVLNVNPLTAALLLSVLVSPVKPREPENAAADDEEVNHENKLYDKVDATVLPVEDKEVNPVQELAR